jgi:hypothetical protein
MLQQTVQTVTKAYCELLQKAVLERIDIKGMRARSEEEDAGAGARVSLRR